MLVNLGSNELETNFVSVKAGTLKIKGDKTNPGKLNSNICGFQGSTVEISNVVMTNDVTKEAIALKSLKTDDKETAAKTKMVFNNVEFKGKVYGFGTNAEGANDYSYGTLEFNNCKFTGLDSTGDDTSVCLNINVKAVFNNCTFNGDRHCLMIRAGEAVLNNCSFNYTGKFSGSNNYLNDEAWGSGNEVPTAIMVVGNKAVGGYKANSKLVLNGTTSINGLENLNETHKSLYVIANSLYGTNVEMNKDVADKLKTNAIVKRVEGTSVSVKIDGIEDKTWPVAE